MVENIEPQGTDTMTLGRELRIWAKAIRILTCENSFRPLFVLDSTVLLHTSIMLVPTPTGTLSAIAPTRAAPKEEPCEHAWHPLIPARTKPAAQAWHSGPAYPCAH